jgi:hypothetical protein
MVEDFVTVRNFRLLPEAEVAQLALDTEGIQTLLSNAGVAFWGNILGSIDLRVPQAQAEAALAILEGMCVQPRTPDDRDGGGADAAVCLECGTQLPADRATCSVCGWSYSDEGESFREGQARAEDQAGSGQRERTSSMDTLQSLKLPLVLFAVSAPLVYVSTGLAIVLVLGGMVMLATMPLAKLLFSGKRGRAGDRGEPRPPSPLSKGRQGLHGIGFEPWPAPDPEEDAARLRLAKKYDNKRLCYLCGKQLEADELGSRVCRACRV